MLTIHLQANFTAVYGYSLNSTDSFIANYTEFLTHIDWSNAVNGTLAETGTSESFTDVTTGKIISTGDPDSFIDFTAEDQIKFEAGGLNFIHISEAASDQIIFNIDNENIDFTMKTDVYDDIFTVDGDTDLVSAYNFTTPDILSCDADNEKLETDGSGTFSCGVAVGGDTFVGNYSNFTAVYGYSLNSTDTDTFVGNYTNFTAVYGYSLNATGISWANAVNGTLALNSSLADYVKTVNWNATNTSYYLETNPFGFYNSTNPSPETLWNANYSDYLLTRDYSYNDTFTGNYSNFTAVYGYSLNATDTDTFATNYSNFTAVYGYSINGSGWVANYSTYLTKPTWAEATNGTILAKVNAINTWTANQTLGTNYITNGTGGAYIRHNGSGWILRG